ncbi:MAG: hypothetical protein DVB23_002359 [Verrucomicrobia bacterium]|nr:MAG: hypothetical protein DVB23_002359 [Verrucomicrobiota bacterium]
MSEQRRLHWKRYINFENRLRYNYLYIEESEGGLPFGLINYEEKLLNALCSGLSYFGIASLNSKPKCNELLDSIQSGLQRKALT